MGFFSWKTQDTDRSICNAHCEGGREPFRVVMLDNKGNRWVEENYDGYGEFGGKDFYKLVAEMNGCESDRDIGIELAFDEDRDDVIFPNLVEYEDNWEWDGNEPKNCEFQGYFYDDDWPEHW